MAEADDHLPPMNIPVNTQLLQRQINEIRVENAEGKKFVPEKEFYDVMSRDVIAKIIADFFPVWHAEHLVNFIAKDARKIFGVLVLINYVGHINCFIRTDQFQMRHVDDLLPFSKATLRAILDDEYVAEMFYDEQWKFSVPVLSGRIIPRVLDRRTVLPYLTDLPLAAGAFGSVQKISIHPSHRPQAFEHDAVVSVVLWDEIDCY